MNEKGHFGHYSLINWWNETFTVEEKVRFKELYKPMGGSYEDLFIGHGGFSNSHVWFLTMLAEFAQNKDDKIIALKFLEKAEELSKNTPTIDNHFLFHSLLQSHYKLRNQGNHYDLAKHYCERQIAISPETKKYFSKEFGGHLPGHSGYQQLAIILEKEKDIQGALKICIEALSEGWNGDWEKRIERLEKKMHGT